jgi:hypothetical protein
MSLEAAIIRLAEAIETLAASTPSLASEPVSIPDADVAQTTIQDFIITYGWPNGSEHGNFGKKKICSGCGKEGFNIRTCHRFHLPKLL